MSGAGVVRTASHDLRRTTPGDNCAAPSRANKPRERCESAGSRSRNDVAKKPKKGGLTYDFAATCARCEHWILVGAVVT